MIPQRLEEAFCFSLDPLLFHGYRIPLPYQLILLNQTSPVLIAVTDLWLNWNFFTAYNSTLLSSGLNQVAWLNQWETRTNTSNAKEAYLHCLKHFVVVVAGACNRVMLQTDKSEPPGLISPSDFTDNEEEFMEKIQTLNEEEGFQMSHQDLERLQAEMDPPSHPAKVTL